jgi:peptide/nickel transport system substrate-binding protein
MSATDLGVTIRVALPAELDEARALMIQVIERDYGYDYRGAGQPTPRMQWAGGWTGLLRDERGECRPGAHHERMTMPMTRRSMLRLALGAATLLTAAPLGALRTVAHDDDSPMPWSPAVRIAMAQALGELRVADNALLQSLDTNLAANGIAVMGLGISETLMRVTPSMQIEPWIAERLDPVDAYTWRVTLRPDVTFHDGSVVDAAAVKASIESSMAAQPGTVSIIPAGTEFSANGLTLDIRTPTPVGVMPSSLAAGNFGIRKTAPDGMILYTGPFYPTDFVERQSAVLNAYQAYRGGPAQSPRILVRSIQDVSTRALALQAGDVDIAQSLLPSDVSKLRTAGFEVYAFPFGRQNDLILNNTRPPLDDVNVRRAVTLAIDREALVAGVMDGVGTAAYALAPDNLGLAGLVNTQYYDPAEAGALLDTAGWTVGLDGIRSRGGRRLTFALGSYVQRAELEPLSVAIGDQLRDIGIDVTLERFSDINKTVAENTFDATMYSFVTAPFGDVNRALLQLYTPSGTNRDRYSNPAVNELFRQYNEAADSSLRLQLLGQIQQLIAQDAPVAYVMNPFQIVGTSQRVRGFTPHPLENYRLGPELSVQP